MICVPFPLLGWHCTQQLLTPRVPALPSASVGEATCSPYLSHLTSSLETSLSAASSLSVCERVGSCKSGKHQERQRSCCAHVFDHPPEVPVIMGVLLTLPQSAACLPKPGEPSVPFFMLFFRSTSSRKEQRCFPKEWTAFCHLFQTWFRGNPVLLFVFVVPLESEQ